MNENLTQIDANCCGNKKEYETKPIFQYDHGITLNISESSIAQGVILKAHFTAAGLTKTLNSVVEKKDGVIAVKIPDVLTFQTQPILCYLYMENEECGVTVKKIVIPVISRPMPSSMDYTPEEKQEFDTLMAQLNSLKTTMSDLTESAEDSKEKAEAAKEAAAISEANAKKYAQQLENNIVTDATLNISGAAADAKVTGNAIREIQATLDELTYKAIVITSFKSDHGVNELGSTVSKTIFSWATNKAPTSISASFGSVKTTDTSFTYATPISKDASFTVTASDGKTTVSATTKVAFVNGVYYGAAAETEITSVFIKKLTRSLQTTKAKTATITAGAGQYIWYAIPSRYGTPSFNVGGFDGGFSKVRTIDFTNASGYTESYDVWRSDNSGLGATTVKIA